MRCVALCALIAILLGPLAAMAQTRLLPVDEAHQVPDFFSFRAQLQATIARRDTEALVGVLHPDVKLSFGGDAGREDFRRLWQPQAATSRVWETLATVLALGGSFAADGTFTAPYVFSRWPPGVDSYENTLALGSGIRVRRAPSPSAPVVGSLDFVIVELAEAVPADAQWAKVKLAQGKVGYVDARLLRSPLEYRVGFVKRDGRWQMLFFLTGD